MVNASASQQAEGSPRWATARRIDRLRTRFGYATTVGPDLVRADNAGALGVPAAAPGVVVVAGRAGHVPPLVPRDDDERFGSQQLKALLAGMVRAAFRARRRSLIRTSEGCE